MRREDSSAAVGRILHRRVQEEIRVAENNIQGSTQFMRHGGEKLALEPIGGFGDLFGAPQAQGCPLALGVEDTHQGPQEAKEAQAKECGEAPHREHIARRKEQNRTHSHSYHRCQEPRP